MKVNPMLCTNQEVHVGVDAMGRPSTVFSTTEIAAIPCIFIHDKVREEVLGNRVVTSKEPLLIGHIKRALIAHKS